MSAHEHPRPRNSSTETLAALAFSSRAAARRRGALVAQLGALPAVGNPRHHPHVTTRTGDGASPQLAGPMVIGRTLLRVSSGALLSRLVPTTSMKVLEPSGKQVTNTATPCPSSEPAPPMWGPEVNVTARPVSVIANSASRKASSCDLARVSEHTWITRT